MMLTGGSATTTAEASAIISDLRSLKAAALMFYVDTMDVSSDAEIRAARIETLARYMDNDQKFGTGTRYGFDPSGEVPGGRWYVTYNAGIVSGATPPGAISSAVRSRLAGRATQVGLLAKTAEIGGTVSSPYNGAEGVIAVIAR